MLSRTTIASLAILAASASAERNCTESNALPRMNKRAPNTTNKVIIQMFGWSWNSIAAECKSTLGPGGVGFVQVNPPQEHLAGDEWWRDYQAVSYQLQSKRGSRAEFATMVGECKNAGVGVIVDTIWNHMAGVDSGSGTAGTQFTHYNYPGLYEWNDFHHCGMTNNDDIQNWGDRNQFQNCELVNLADLNTGSEKVQSKLAAFTNDLLSLGVDGLRLDAAKHMSSGDIRGIMSKLSRRPYITQEIVDTDGSIGGEYTDIGDVQEFRYSEALKKAFNGDGIAWLKGIENRNWLKSDRANVFVVNHDQERGGSALSWRDDKKYTLAHVFMLSYPYGTPTVLSSFYFDTNNNGVGAPNGGYGTCNGASGVNGWICQHRWTAVAGMIKFYNKVGSGALNNWVQGSNQQIAFARGNAGFVAINNEDGPWTRTFKASLPNATYCNVINGKKSGITCTSDKVTINGGSFTVTVPGRSAVAYHIGAKY